jgi:hypothetical protein
LTLPTLETRALAAISASTFKPLLGEAGAAVAALCNTLELSPCEPLRLHHQPRNDAGSNG